jgi:L-threonylcarbamoyladenylate synthase
MKYRHYAPSARVRLTSSLCNLETATSHKKIGFDSNADQRVDSNESYAQELYSFFIACDREGIEEIWCQAPRPGHLYDALMNRLLKASNH